MWGYILISLLVGLGQLLLKMGADGLTVIALPDFALEPEYYSSGGSWAFLLAAFFIQPALVFISGGLVADVAKLKTFASPQEWMSGAAGRLAKYAAGTERTTSEERLAGRIRWTGALLPLIVSPIVIAALLKLADTLVRVSFYLITKTSLW